MPIAQAQFRYAVPLSGTYVLRVQTDISTANVNVGPFDPYTDYFMLGDDSAADALGFLSDALASHADIATATVTLDADHHVNIAFTGTATTVVLLWSHASTTADGSTWGWVDDVDSSVLTSPAVPMGWLPTIGGRPVSDDSRPRQRVVGGITKSLSGMTRASRWALPATERTLSADLVLQTYALDEYAPVTSPYATFESMFVRSLSLGRACHYIPDAADPDTYSVLRLAPPMPDLDGGLVRSDASISRLRWSWSANFVADAEFASGVPTYPFAPFDVGGTEAYFSAMPLTGLWVERDQTRDAAANTRVAADGDAVGRVDDPAQGHVLWCEGADSLRPLWRAGGAHPHLEFDGTDDRLQVMNSATGSFDYFFETAVGSVLARVGFRNDGVASVWATTRSSAGGGHGIELGRNASNQLTVLVVHTSTVFSFVSTATVTAAMGIVPVEIRFDNANGGDLRINGGTLETFALTNAPAAGTNSNDWFVGARSAGGLPAQLDLADLLITSTYVPDADVVQWRGLGLAGFPATFARQTGPATAAGAPWFNYLRRWHDFTNPATMWTDDFVTLVVANNDPIQNVGHAADPTQHLGRTMRNTGTARPFYQTDGTGALFDGTDDNLASPTSDRDDTLGGAKTLVFVFRHDTAAATDTLMLGHNGTNAATITLDMVASNIEWFDNGVATGLAAAPTAIADYHVIAFTRDAAGAWTARTRGGAVSTVTNTRGIQIWGLGVGGTTTIDGRLVEVLVWNIALTTDELAVVFDGLADKHPTLGL